MTKYCGEEKNVLSVNHESGTSLRHYFTLYIVMMYHFLPSRFNISYSKLIDLSWLYLMYNYKIW
jgi:hypothetical protein